MNSYLKPFSLILLLLISISVNAAGTKDLFNIDCDKVGVHFENDGIDFVMTFDDDKLGKVHSVIDINRTDDLKYRTRVMRYFGGLLVNKTFPFEKIIVITKDNRLEMPFTRENISKIVNMMCNPPAPTVAQAKTIQ